MRRHIIICTHLLFMLCTVLPWTLHAGTEVLRLGVLAKRGTELAYSQWRPLAQYLQQHLPGYECRVVPLAFSEISQAVEKKQVDFLLVNPAIYVDMESRYGVSRIATEKNCVRGHLCHRFGGVILVRRQAKVHKVEDLKQRNVMAVAPYSLGGWIAQWRELHTRGIDPEQDFANLSFGGTHDRVVYAVRDGLVDAGCVRSDTMERMAAEGHISMDDFRVLEARPPSQRKNKLPFLLSTRTYPEWPFATLSHVPEKIAKATAIALFNLPEQHPAATAAHLAGWTIPQHYQPVHTCMQELHLGPYAKLGLFTLKDVWQKYRLPALGLLSGLLTLFAVTLYVNRLNRALRLSQTELRAARDELELRVVERTAALQRERDFVQSILDTSQALIMLLDKEGHILLYNQYMARLLNQPLEQVRGQDFCSAFLAPNDQGSCQQHFFQALKGISGNGLSTFLLGSEGQHIEVEWYDHLRQDQEGNILGVLMVGRDLTKQRQTEASLKANQEKLAYLAHYDMTTGLPNRVLCYDRLQQALTRADTRNQHLAVMQLDLDRFNKVNDTLGHEQGDQLLKQLASELQPLVPKGSTLGRLGGDEFFVLLEGEKDLEQLAQLAQELLGVIAMPHELQGETLYVTATLGIAMFPQDGHDAETLLQHADAAMFRGKERGGNTCQFYTAELGQRVSRNLRLANNLRRALMEQEFILYYQPQINIEHHRLVGWEALIRWQHPKEGFLSPAEFIPIAEETGIIVEMGQWVLETACNQARHWQQQGWPGIMAVNLSTRQFREPGLAASVTQTLAQSGLEAAKLELEITESMLMHDEHEALRVMQELAQNGVRFAIDDFGTGYSSFRYLKQFPVHKLKLDATFVRGLPSDHGDASICRSVIHLAESLGLCSLAEGVEETEQLQFLRAQGCHEVQGYHFSKPLPAHEMEAFMQEWSTP